MRRLIGVTIVSTLLVLGTAGPAAAIPGPEAKEWAAKIARLGQRPAGGLNERRAGEIVRRRLATLGYDVTIQRFRLPNGQMSRNVVGRTSGPVRVIIVAHMDGVHRTQAANDNASGVGVMLTVARFLAGEDGVLVAAMGAEERMVTGSSWHLGSRRLTSGFSAAQKAGVRLALSVDMVGFGSTLNIRGLESTRTARRAACSTPPAPATSAPPTSGTPGSPTTTTSRAAASRPPGSNGAGTRAGTSRATGSTGSGRTSSATPAASCSAPRAQSSSSRALGPSGDSESPTPFGGRQAHPPVPMMRLPQ